MKKAYCVIKDLSEEAKSIIKKNNIELYMDATGKILTTKELITLLKTYDILIIGIKTHITKEILKHIHSKKIIGTLSIGVDHIDQEVFDSNQVDVVNIKNANAISVAEHIFALILTLNKRIFESNTLVLNQKGKRQNLEEKPEDISNQKLGLIGAGTITSEVIKIAKVFHLKMICYTKHPNRHKDLLEYGIQFVSLKELLKTSDIINISIPLNEKTKYLISSKKIEWMKPTATFINTSRRDVVDLKALIEYADKNKRFHVGLDIDLDGYEDLFAKYRKNVIVTPHIAGTTKQSVKRMDIELAQNIIIEVNKK